MATPETLEKHAVKDYLDLLGFFHFPLVAGMASYRGAPDRIAIKAGKVYAIEVKGAKGRQTDHEKAFEQDWTRAGGIYLIGDANKIISQLKR